MVGMLALMHKEKLQICLFDILYFGVEDEKIMTQNVTPLITSLISLNKKNL